jgi:hypothetical protein
MNGSTGGYGASGEKILELVDAIRQGAVTKAGGFAVEQTSIIKNTARMYWAGGSEEKFEAMLDLDANRFYNKVAELVEAVVTEISNAGQSYSDFDRQLMNNVMGGN